jgi:hypothetical protein
MFGSVSEALSHARKSNSTVGGCSAAHMMATLAFDAERSSRTMASSADSETQYRQRSAEIMKMFYSYGFADRLEPRSRTCGTYVLKCLAHNASAETNPFMLL